MRHIHILVRATIGLCVIASVAAAEPSDSERDSARELMKEGRKQRTSGDLQGALKSFAAANELMHVPTTLYEVAVTETALGRLLAAKDSLKEIAAIDEQPDEPDAFKKARQGAKELAVSLEQRIPTVQLSFAGEVAADPKLMVDDHPFPEGQDTSHLRLDPGKHVISASTDSAKGQQSISLGEGETRLLTITLENSAAQSAPPHQESAKLEGVRERPSPWAAYTLGGLGLAAVGTGFAFGAQAQHVKSSLQHSCAPTCSTSDAARVHHWSTAANVSFGVGAAALTSAIIVYLVQTSGPADTRPAAASNFGLQVVPSPQGATFRAEGRF